MAILESLILSGRIVDLMLVFIMLEIILFAWLRRRRGFSLPALLVNVGAGGSLMLALRASLTDAGWHWIAMFLVSALAFHVADVAGRWRAADERAGA